MVEADPSFHHIELDHLVRGIAEIDMMERHPGEPGLIPLLVVYRRHHQNMVHDRCDRSD